MTHITTFSGKQFDPSNIDNAQFDLEDIAHALARIVRFNGHQEYSYSVGAHSICCAHYAMQHDDLQPYAREALMHDAAEAYLCDVPTPLKLLLPEYQRMEHELDIHLRAWSNLPLTMSEQVRSIDKTMLIAEAFVLHPRLWEEMGRPPISLPARDLVQSMMHFGARNMQSNFLALAAELP